MADVRSVYFTCATCGKQSYATRKDARRVANHVFPGEHFQTYRCGDYWHITHALRKSILGVEPQ